MKNAASRVLPHPAVRHHDIRTIFGCCSRSRKTCALHARFLTCTWPFLSAAAKAKGRKSRYVPILPELAQELRTHLGHRSVGYLFETIHHRALTG